jgi:hypothetical protein
MSRALLYTPVVATISDPSENHALIPSRGLYCSEIFHMSPFFIHTIFLPNLTVKVISTVCYIYILYHFELSYSRLLCVCWQETFQTRPVMGYELKVAVSAP